MYLRFLRVFNFPFRCGSVLIMSLQNLLQISCDFQVFLRFSMKSTNLNTFMSRSHYTITLMFLSAKSVHFRFGSVLHVSLENPTALKP